MPAFASTDGVLSVPSEPHPSPSKYEPLAVGKPLCVEILHWSFGDIRDWWGKSELLSASQAKLGGSPKAGPRVVHFIRDGISPFDYVDQLGADQYAHRLVFYTPSYDGTELRLTLQYVELDRVVKRHVQSVAKALVNLAVFSPFAAKLPFMATLESTSELGRKVYNLLNRNDRILSERLDFRLDDRDFYRLTAGRYVVVGGSHRPDTFVRDYRLGEEGVARNRLTTADGRLLGESLRSPYAVLRVDGRERPEYEGFEMDSAAQEMVEAVLNNRELTEDVADVISDAAKAAKEYGTVRDIIKSKEKMDGAKSEEEKAEERVEIENLLRRLGNDERAELLKEVLRLETSTAGGVGSDEGAGPAGDGSQRDDGGRPDE